jgi:hypothetical protein
MKREIPTAPDSNAVRSPSAINLNGTTAPARIAPSATDDAHSESQEISATPAETVDGAGLSISPIASNNPTAVPAEVPAQELPTPVSTMPVDLASDESLAVIDAKDVADFPIQALVPQSAEAESPLPISSIKNSANPAIADASNVAAGDASDSAASAANAPSNRGTDDASNAIKAVPVGYGETSNDSDSGGPSTSDLLPETTQITATTGQPATLTIFPATPTHVVSRGSEANPAVQIENENSTSKFLADSSADTEKSGRNTTTVQVASNPTQTISQTELWVGMHSSRLSSSTWSTAAFTNSDTRTESTASAQTSAQLLGAQTILGTSSQGASTKHFTQPVDAPVYTVSKTVASSNKTDRASVQQKNSQPASASGELVASATLAIAVPGPQVAPVQTFVSASNDAPLADEATSMTMADTSTGSLLAQAQVTPGPVPVSQTVTDPFVTANAAVGSNGAANETDAVAATTAGTSLRTLGFTPQTADDEFNLPTGIVPSMVAENTSTPTQSVTKQVGTQSDGAPDTSAALANVIAANASAATENRSVIGDGLSTDLQNSSQPVQDFRSAVPRSSGISSQSQGSDTIKAQVRGLASEAEVFSQPADVAMSAATSGIADPAPQREAGGAEGSSISNVSNSPDDTGLAQSVAAATSGQITRLNAPLDTASVSRFGGDATAQSRPAPMQVASDAASTIPVSQSDPVAAATASSSVSGDASAQTQTAPMRDVSNDSSTITASTDILTNSTSQHISEADTTRALSGNGSAAVQLSDISTKPIDAMSETELWVGMHRSIRESGSALPEQTPALQATLQQTLPTLSTQPESGVDLGTGVNTNAHVGAQQRNSPLPDASDAAVASSLSAPAHSNVTPSDSDRQLNAGPSATSGTAANDLISTGTQHSTPKPPGVTAPSATTNAASTVSKSADAATPQDTASGPDSTPQKGPSTSSQISGEVLNLLGTLPSDGDLANGGVPTQSARKAGSKETASAVGSKVSNLSDTTDANTNISTQTGAGSSAGSSTGSQTGGQATQHSAADASQAAPVIAKAPDATAAVAQSVAPHSTSHTAGTGTTESNKDVASQNNRGSEAAMSPSDPEENVTRSSINTSKLMQTMSESEMRVGMHSSEFGSISIRTTVSPQQMLTQISTDHTDLGQAISAHAASVETKLGNDSGLRTLIEVNQQAATSSGNSGSSPQREQQAFVRSVRADSTAVPVEADVGVIPAALVNTSNGYRLDIRA